MRSLRPRSFRGIRGFTLVEIAIAIGIIVFLLGALGLTGVYIRSESDKKLDIATQKRIQDAVRAVAGIEGLSPGDNFPSSKIIGTGKWFESAPLTPKGNAYTYLDVVPDVGTPYATSPDGNTPPSTAGW